MRVRSRVRALIETIGRQVEADRFARPTMIQLDFRTRPLGESVDALNDRYNLGLSLRLGPEPGRGMMIADRDAPDRLKQLRAREIRARAARPLPFWEASTGSARRVPFVMASRPCRGSGPARAPCS